MVVWVPGHTLLSVTILLATWDRVWPQGDQAGHWPFGPDPLHVKQKVGVIRSRGGWVWQGPPPTDSWAGVLDSGLIIEAAPEVCKGSP